MEKILNIVEHTEKDYSRMSGYMITTDKQEIKLLIDDEGQCCESWGYFMSEDSSDEFIGANLLDIKITDTELKEGILNQHEVDVNSSWFEGGIMFVNIETSVGLLQFVAYNEHNGYYGHEAKVISTQLTHEEYL